MAARGAACTVVTRWRTQIATTSAGSGSSGAATRRASASDAEGSAGLPRSASSSVSSNCSKKRRKRLTCEGVCERGTGLETRGGRRGGVRRPRTRLDGANLCGDLAATERVVLSQLHHTERGSVDVLRPEGADETRAQLAHQVHLVGLSAPHDAEVELRRGRRQRLCARARSHTPRWGWGSRRMGLRRRGPCERAPWRTLPVACREAGHRGRLASPAMRACHGARSAAELAAGTHPRPPHPPRRE